MSPKGLFCLLALVDVKMLLASSFRAEGLMPPAAAAPQAAAVPGQPLPGCLR